MNPRTACFFALAVAGCLPRPPDFDPGTDDSAVELGQIQVNPSEVVQLPGVVIGCGVETQVNVANTGAGLLSIESFEVQNAEAGLSFELSDQDGKLPLPWTLESEDSVVLGFIVYAPTDEPESQELGNLIITSTDPTTPDYKLRVQGLATEPYSDSESFTAGARPMDVLFTVDHSGSTFDDRGALMLGFWDFAQALYAYGIDYQIMAVTTLDGCVVTKERWIDDGFGEAAAEGLFEAMIAVEPKGGDLEAAQGLLRAKNALSVSNTGSGGCNDGFLREDAMLHVVGISDEADASPDGHQGYIDDMLLMNKWPAETVFHGIGAPDGAACSFEYTGFIEAVAQTSGQGVSICEPAWESTLGGFGTAMVNRADPTTYQLEGTPDEDSVQVYVATEVLSSGLWDYDKESKTVVIVSSAAPALGDTVRVDYDIEPVCE